MQHDPAQIQKTIQREIHEMIGLQGFAIRQVQSSGDQPPFAYTIGLHLDPSLPELVVSGLPPMSNVAWLLTLGYQMKGSLLTPNQRRFAARQGFLPSDVPVRFVPGMLYDDLTDAGFPCCFGEVEPRYGTSHFGQALAYYATETLPVLQMIWTDRQGRFPWHSDFEVRLRDRQQLLFDPKRYDIDT